MSDLWFGLGFFFVRGWEVVVTNLSEDMYVQESYEATPISAIFRGSDGIIFEITNLCLVTCLVEP